MKTTTHRVPFRGFAIVLSYLTITIGLMLLLLFLLQWVTGNEPDNSRVIDFLFAGFPILIGCAVVNLYPNIEVREDGLCVQVFGFHWMFVPWSDLISMTELKSPYSSGPPRGIVVRAHGLTFIHHLIVASLTKETTRGFVISNSISGYDQLVETIREKLEEGAA